MASVRTKPTTKSRGVCKYYMTQLGCHQGDRCKFSHSQDGTAITPFDKSKTCRFYARGFCRLGEECWFQHVDPTDAPSDEPESCSICMDTPVTYGLLSDCCHSFCISCIRQWRDKEGKPEDLAVQTRKCPICRTSSKFIFPSSKFYALGDSRKEEALRKYKESTARVLCKHFEKSNHTSCPFGKDCFYKHQKADGTIHVFEHGVGRPPPRRVSGQNVWPEALERAMLESLSTFMQPLRVLQLAMDNDANGDDEDEEEEEEALWIPQLPDEIPTLLRQDTSPILRALVQDLLDDAHALDPIPPPLSPPPPPPRSASSSEAVAAFLRSVEPPSQPVASGSNVRLDSEEVDIEVPPYEGPEPNPRGTLEWTLWASARSVRMSTIAINNSHACLRDTRRLLRETMAHNSVDELSARVTRLEEAMSRSEADLGVIRRRRSEENPRLLAEEADVEPSTQPGFSTNGHGRVVWGGSEGGGRSAASRLGEEELEEVNPEDYDVHSEGRSFFGRMFPW